MSGTVRYFRTMNYVEEGLVSKSKRSSQLLVSKTEEEGYIKILVVK